MGDKKRGKKKDRIEGTNHTIGPILPTARMETDGIWKLKTRKQLTGNRLGRGRGLGVGGGVGEEENKGWTLIERMDDMKLVSWRHADEERQ